MADWLAERSGHVEHVTGMLGLAADLLQLAQQTHPQEKVGVQLGALLSFQEALQGKNIPFFLQVWLLSHAQNSEFI